MILEPVLPVPLLVVLALALVGFAGWRLAASRDARERLAWALRIVAVLLLVVVALRPVLPSPTVTRAQASGGLEVYIAVDTTSSMAAEDWDSDAPRLDGVKADIRAMAEGLVGASFSLVTFDAESVQRVPLTSDGSALASATEALAQEITFYSRGSSIDEPVELLTEILTEAAEENPGQDRVLFYLGDGEQTASSEPGSFDALAPLITGGAVLGYGTPEGAPMREFSGYVDPQASAPYIQDYTSGAPTDAVSRIDETRLGTVAQQLGVPYVHRDAGTSIAGVLSAFDVGEVSVSEGSEGSRTELYWIAAIPLGMLALLQLVALAGAVAEARAATGGRRREERA
jgi:Ca-activated chloride channel family protein